MRKTLSILGSNALADKSHLEIGKLGENIATRKLESLGYRILARNYRKKHGEIDIVCEAREETKRGTYFVEVKSKLVTNRQNSTKREDSFRLEDNVHEQKLRRLRRVIQIFIHEKALEKEEPHFMVILVKIYPEKTYSLKILPSLVV